MQWRLKWLSSAACKCPQGPRSPVAALVNLPSVPSLCRSQQHSHHDWTRSASHAMYLMEYGIYPFHSSTTPRCTYEVKVVGIVQTFVTQAGILLIENERILVLCRALSTYEGPYLIIHIHIASSHPFPPFPSQRPGHSNRYYIFLTPSLMRKQAKESNTRR